MKNGFICLLTDLALAALILLGIYYFGYCTEQKGIPVHAVTASNGIYDSSAEENLNSLARTAVSDKKTNWKEKFADKFSDTIISTDNNYKSPQISVTLTKKSINTDRFDTSENGKHKKYGTNIAYTLADIYIADISCLKTAFAKDTYGIGYSEKLSSMSDRIKSVLAVNGDSYNNNRHKDNGIIIRNGIVYRTASTNVETCVLNYDGTMKIYSPNEINAQELIDGGAYQSWIFGPSLLDANGKAKTQFLTWDYIRESHPRTAIGYYEPGHYCLLVVDGRQKDYSRGMFLDEMAQLLKISAAKRLTILTAATARL